MNPACLIVEPHDLQSAQRKVATDQPNCKETKFGIRWSVFVAFLAVMKINVRNSSFACLKCGADNPTPRVFAFCCIITEEILYKVGDLTILLPQELYQLFRDPFSASLCGYKFLS